jgi:hypothetical protein
MFVLEYAFPEKHRSQNQQQMEIFNFWSCARRVVERLYDAGRRRMRKLCCVAVIQFGFEA